ncbi:hypothetical protein NQF87_05830 [Bombella sp. TMW 2.2559]|uniref:Glycosyltransferase RgtA/B/C/D-like domain-containing protein n=1 Tax=Bombella dulcis TaxID=2967339 RepID=A0ABT3WBP1_9PROT|nr:hypothetical protein [Bombella dulcis]MCX5616491.1 hypothetical protein [Bombella dulcis]
MFVHEKKDQVIWFWCIVWAALFLLTCTRTVLVMFHHVPLDVNEGWNAQLASWTAGGDHRLYSSDRGFVFNNYPPLSFVLMGGLVQLGCDAIITGRILSCFSVLVSAVLIARIIRIVTGTLPAALATASLFLLTANTAFHGYFGMNDPQWLAQALMLGALCVMISRKTIELTGQRLFCCAFLIVLGGFTKHNLVALPFAMFIWLFCVDLKKAVLWSVILGLLLAAGFVICYEVYGISFFRDVFLHQRVIRLGRVIHSVRQLPFMGGMLLVGVGVFVQRWRSMDRRDPSVLVMLFLVFGCLFGFLESLGEGVDYNCMFDAFVAASILCGIGLACLSGSEGKRKKLVQVCWVMALPVLCLLPLWGMTSYQEVQTVRLKDNEWQIYIQSLRMRNTSLLCTDMALCYWADSRDAIDRFNLSQALKKNEEVVFLREMIIHHRFSVVQLYGTMAHYSSGNIIFDSWLAKAGYRPVMDNGEMILLGYIR